MKKVFLIGGAGYIGSELTKKLLNKGYQVEIYDLFLYGDNISDHKNLKKTRGDIRDIKYLEKKIKFVDYIIHLACISNDPSFDLDPDLGKSINYDPFEKLVQISRDKGVKRFIYASSSSVYGIKNFQNVDEDCSLEPITDYSRFKVMCEEILYKYNTSNFVCSSIRPATVCGYSDRQRLDLVVNILTNLAYNKGKIIVYGGDQLRPNIHISDICNSYLMMLEVDKNLINGQSFNVGFENYSVNLLAEMVKDTLSKNISIIKELSNDDRSYHISSKKIKKILNFKPSYSIKDAILDLKKAFEQKKFKNPLDNEMYFNINRMKSLKLK